MKSKINLLVIFLLLLGCRPYKIKISDLQQENIYGNAKSIKEYFYETDSEHYNQYLSNNKALIKRYTLFNVEGFIIEENEYRDGKLHRKRRNTYDKDENLVKEVSYDSNEDIKWVDLYTYNKKGYLVENTSIDSLGGIFYRLVNKYDRKGNLVKETYNNTKEPPNIHFYKYDRDNRLIEEGGYDSKGNVDWRNEYTYDVNGNEIENRSYGYSIDYLTTKKYDLSGNVIEQCSHYPSNNQLDNKIITNWDSHHNQLKIFNYDGEFLRKEITIEYLYDENNNWIKEIDYDSDGSIEITIREFEYYK
jgi:hypothetical protein